MKVTFVHNFDPLDSSAIPANILKLAVGLIEKGFECTIVSQNATNETEFKGVKIKKLVDFNQLAEVVAAADVLLPVINFTSINKPVGVAVAGLCDELKKPFFPMVRTTEKVAMFNQYKDVSDFDQSVNLNAMKKALNSEQCKKVICVSNAVKDSVKKLGVPESKLVVIFDGVDFDRQVFEDVSNVEKELDIIFVGRLSKEKGVTLFLSTIKLVKEKFPKVKVCVVGTGIEEGLTKSLTKVLDLEDNVMLMPKLENGHLLEQIKKAKILLSTSFTESFGIAVVEAMALGVAVVAPDIEGPLEITKNGEFGFLYKLCDTGMAAGQIIKILNGGSSVGQKILASREQAISSFSIKTQLETIVSLLTIWAT